MAGEVVRVHNVGENDFVGGYEQQRYQILAGKQAVVPTDAAKHWTGRWDLIDKDRRKERSAEVQRLRVLYGIFNDSEGTEAEKTERNVPKFEVFDLDENRIVTVLEDPTGKGLTPVDTTAQEKDLIDDQIDTLKRQMAALIKAQAAAEINKNDTYEASPEVVEEVPQDKPTKVPVTDGPRRGRTPAGS